MRLRRHDYQTDGFTNKTPTASITELRFRRLLNDIQWAKLPKAIKKRFSHKPLTGHTKVYHGKIIETNMNWIGKTLSRVMLLLGGSLPLDTNNGGAEALVTVSAYNGANGNDAQVWTRQYARRNRAPQIIQSRKQFSGPTGLEEFLGQGIGMTLKLEATDNALLFIAERFFVEIFGRRIYLPKALNPGALTISHINQTDNTFIFGMTLVHPLFGKLVSQSILFTDPKETR